MSATNDRPADDDILEYIDPGDLRPDAEALSESERNALDLVNRRVAGMGSIEEVLRFLSLATREVCPCDRIGLAFLEEDDARITAHCAVAGYEPLLLGAGYSEELGGSSLGDIIRTGSMRLIHDLEAYLRRHPRSASTRLVVREGLRSSVTCPLYVEGRVVAVLFRSSRRTRAYDRRRARLFAAMADRVAQAVEKAWRIERLEQANNGYMELLGFVSHELKSPLASIVSSANILSDGYLGELEPKQKEKLRGIAARADHLLGIVREYLDLARIEGGEMEPNFAPIEDFGAEVVEPAAEIVAPEMEAASMSLDRAFTGSPIAVEGDANLLKIVLTNLLSNAAKYGRRGGRIEVAAEADGESLAVRVWNEGPGFPAGQRSRLFRRFSRLQTPDAAQKKGTGVGLYTCWRIVRMHGGRIEADSEEGSWAGFSFEIPVSQTERRHAGNDG